jgi:hypothetical protein
MGKIIFFKETMMKKLTPLLILSIFAVGVLFMIYGMNNALKVTDPLSAKQTQSKSNQ